MISHSRILEVTGDRRIAAQVELLAVSLPAYWRLGMCVRRLGPASRYPTGLVAAFAVEGLVAAGALLAPDFLDSVEELPRLGSCRPGWEITVWEPRHARQTGYGQAAA